MEIIVTRSAKEALRSITEYYVEKGYSSYADRIKSSLYNGLKLLQEHADLGRFEDQLQPLGKNHSFIIIEKYY